MSTDGTETITWEPSERWVRGTKGGTTVVDSHHPVLVWEPGSPVPLYAFPEDEVRTDLLRGAEKPDTGAHAGSTVFYDLHVEGEVIENAAWTFPGKELADHIAFAWFGRSVLDHWYEEEEEIFVHPRDPHKRVDPIPSSRHVRVEIEGAVVADTRSPVLLFETGLPVRYYIPRADVRFDHLTPTDHHSRCPYKGIADYWSWTGGGRALPNVAWSYPAPIRAAGQIEDLVCFYNETVDITVDGERLERPVTVFSKPI
ncbi:DUF427 domain-containing protein [Streptomyces sp. 8N706]|uniref:DUF427 domain-containing protein n=1 Tax=Streptomyces sp. 8N706 TaxID=3457416 RepID=UPI003FD51629